ncbi:alpha/beta hydrolase [Neolewinella persica]|uniref:alpha/beta hydrolase n=1 Tax=Neolewinella persica TaxID=70998 RepID=UPI0004771F77|nr:alpha/beta hydrolase [Neolewinella persica]
MNYRNTLLFNTFGLPAYWSACRSARAEMDITEEKVHYGKHRRQYAVVVRGANSGPDKYAFYFHGGAWTFGRPETFIPAAIPWLKLGFTVVLPSYRRPPRVGLDRIVADCRAAITQLVPADPNEVKALHIGGISAGAHLAALMALHPEWWKQGGWQSGPEKALLCAGPLCLSDLQPGKVFGRYPHLDPYARLREGSPSSLQWQLLHGTADATVAFQHSEKFHEQLLEKNAAANLLCIPDGTHLDSGRWMFGGVGAEEVAQFLGGCAGAGEKKIGARK